MLPTVQSCSTLTFVLKRSLSCESRHPSVIFIIYLTGENGGAYELFDPNETICQTKHQLVMFAVGAELMENKFVQHKVHGWRDVFTGIVLEPLAIEAKIPVREEEKEKEKSVANNKCDDVIKDHASFFRAICLTSEQLTLVRAELPDGVPTDQLFILSGFNSVVLTEYGLKRVQISAWTTLIETLLTKRLV